MPNLDQEKKYFRCQVHIIRACEILQMSVAVVEPSADELADWPVSRGGCTTR
jgi:hypothetical protein